MERNGTAAAILIGVWATFALDVFSTFTSSPQTTELNAASRAETLMKWVTIGAVVAILGGLVGTVKSGKAWPLLASTAVTLVMVGFYRHARDAGLKNGGEPTEAY